MINYRDHSGILQESLETSRTYKSLLDLFNDLTIMLKSWPGNKKINITDFTIQYYAYDDRIKQHLFIVTYTGNTLGFIFEYEEQYS